MSHFGSIIRQAAHSVKGVTAAPIYLRHKPSPGMLRTSPPPPPVPGRKVTGVLSDWTWNSALWRGFVTSLIWHQQAVRQGALRADHTAACSRFEILTREVTAVLLESGGRLVTN